MSQKTIKLFCELHHANKLKNDRNQPLTLILPTNEKKIMSKLTASQANESNDETIVIETYDDGSMGVEVSNFNEVTGSDETNGFLLSPTLAKTLVLMLNSES